MPTAHTINLHILVKIVTFLSTIHIFDSLRYLPTVSNNQTTLILNSGLLNKFAVSRTKIEMFEQIDIDDTFREVIL